MATLLGSSPARCKSKTHLVVVELVEPSPSTTERGGDRPMIGGDGLTTSSPVRASTWKGYSSHVITRVVATGELAAPHTGDEVQSVKVPAFPARRSQSPSRVDAKSGVA